MVSGKHRPRQFLSCQQAAGLSGSECLAQSHSCMIFSLASFLFSNTKSWSSDGFWVLTVDLVEFCMAYVQIQLFNQNVNNTLTFEFFALWCPPSASILNSFTVTTFILWVDFFPFFSISSTTNGLSLWDIDVHDVWEFRSNGRDVWFLLLKWYGVVVLMGRHWVPQWPSAGNCTKQS